MLLSALHARVANSLGGEVIDLEKSHARGAVAEVLEQEEQHPEPEPDDHITEEDIFGHMEECM